MNWYYLADISNKLDTITLLLGGLVILSFVRLMWSILHGLQLEKWLVLQYQTNTEIIGLLGEIADILDDDGDDDDDDDESPQIPDDPSGIVLDEPITDLKS